MANPICRTASIALSCLKGLGLRVNPINPKQFEGLWLGVPVPIYRFLGFRVDHSG